MTDSNIIKETSVSFNDLPWLGPCIATNSKKLFLILALIKETQKWFGEEDLKSFIQNYAIDKETLNIVLANDIEISTPLRGALYLDENQPIENLKTYFISYVAFSIILGSNPFLGGEFFQKISINREWEKDYFQRWRHFIFGSEDRNRPDNYYQHYTIKEWSNQNWDQLKGQFERIYSSSSSLLNESLSKNRNDLIAECYRLYASTRSKSENIKAKNHQDNIEFNLFDGKRLISPDLSILGIIRKDPRTGILEILFDKNYSEIEATLKNKNSGKVPNKLSLEQIAQLNYKDNLWIFE